MPMTPAGQYGAENLALLREVPGHLAPIGQRYDQLADEQRGIDRKNAELNAPATEMQQWLAERMAEGWTVKEAAIAVKAGFGPGGKNAGQQPMQGPQAPVQNLGGGQFETTRERPAAGPAQMPDPSAQMGSPRGTPAQMPEPRMGMTGGAQPAEMPDMGPESVRDPYFNGMQINVSRGGGMTGGRDNQFAEQRAQQQAQPAQGGSRPMPRVRTNRDFMAVQNANATMQKPALNAATNQTKETIARTKEEGMNDRFDEKQKFEAKKLKEKAAQFDSMMQYYYDKLDAREDEISAQIRSRERIANSKQGNAEALKLLQEDVKILKKYEDDIARLQNEKTRAGNLLSPEQAAIADKMIKDLRKKADHLSFSIDVQMRQRGGRAGLREAPGSGPDEQPMFGPAQDYSRPDNRTRPMNTMNDPQMSSGGNGPPLDTSVDVQEPGGPSVWVEDRSTGAQVKIPASVVEADLRKMGSDRWSKKYRPIKRED